MSAHLDSAQLLVHTRDDGKLIFEIQANGKQIASWEMRPDAALQFIDGMREKAEWARAHLDEASRGTWSGPEDGE